MSTNGRVDAIIVGGGHNGLITAGYLARAGLKVTVLERRPIVGGACVTEEIAPGFRVSRTSYATSLLMPEIVRDFRMKEQGYRVYIPDPAGFIPFPDGRYLLTHSDTARFHQEVAKFSNRDAAALEKFETDLSRLRPLVEKILRMTPPNFPPSRIKDYWSFLKLTREVRRLDKKDLRFFMELMTASCAEILDKRFESTEIKAMLAHQGTIGACTGVMSPGSAYVMLHDSIGGVDGQPGAWGFVYGGMGAITQILARTCRDRGVEIRTGAEVERILVRNGRAQGVVLQNGDELRSRIVVSNADPKRTFLKMIEPHDLDADFLEDIRNFKIEGSSIKVNCALGELPNWKCLPGQDPKAPQHQAMLEIGPSMEYLEQAYDDMKYGRPSRRPFIEGTIASVVDESLAPKGKHVLSLFVQYGPYHLKEGSWPEIREKVGDNIIETLAEYAPNIKSAIIAREVLSPWDLEQEFGLTGGQIFHGEISQDQLFCMRPAWGWADYRSPVRGMYLCGSGAHPGGGVMGGPGMNASREILRDFRKR
ncbi:MAG: NAD(P)/FAD-dependent oxidoreductase [Acidobacteria bacterium]|nr:NAD(P)/FAD-dependent oxidoreductase [Acidobacteriota bacterium]